MSDESDLRVACPHCHTLNRLPQTRLDQRPNCGRCHQSLFVGTPIEVDVEGFEQHALRSDVPVLIDFWAPWCGPCRMMAPAFAQAAAQLEPWVQLLKLDTEAHPALGQRFAIRSIPTLVMMHRGQELARQSGALPLGGIVDFAQRTLRQHFG